MRPGGNFFAAPNKARYAGMRARPTNFAHPGGPAESIRRPGTHRAGELSRLAAAQDRRRPAACPYAASTNLFACTGAPID